MRIVMMGTGPFAVPSFRRLLDSSHEVCALVTRPVPEAPPGRRVTVPPNPMREVAEAVGLPIVAPPSINSADAVAQLRAWNADLFMVCDYGQILSNEALACSRLGGINLHASLLPKYRGAAPINWAIHAGEFETGVTVIHMTPRLDAGPCLVQRATPIGPQEDAGQLERRLSEIGAEAVMESLGMLEAWDGSSPLGEIQDPSRATRAPRLKKSDGEVNWQQSAEQIARQVRAFQPWPGTYTHWQRTSAPLRLVLWQVEAEPQASGCALPGTVMSVDDQSLRVACGSGMLRITELQSSGKNRLPAAQFLRGYPLQVGERLGVVAD
jgi:methionyl-tRNA formyltransferase